MGVWNQTMLKEQIDKWRRKQLLFFDRSYGVSNKVIMLSEKYTEMISGEIN